MKGFYCQFNWNSRLKIPKNFLRSSDNSTMRTSNKSSIITGAVLLVLAALFSISLILLPLDYGVAGPGHNNFFYIFGDMLYSVYGFCSILIPVFLIIAGLSCFAAKWTARKTMRLITALVPFFTCVITETIVRSIVKVDHSPFAIAKILIAVLTGAMLVVIEYLGTGLLADRINKRVLKSYPRNQDETDESENQFKEDLPITSENESETEESIPEFKKLSKIKVPKKSFLDKFKKSKDFEDDSISVSEMEATSDSNTPTVFDEALDELEQNPAQSQALDSAESNNQNDSEKSNGRETNNSMLTQEEFAALTNPQDELEWPDLPPQPETLPPEYDADFDEDDPALAFPPKDEEEPLNEAQESQADSEDETVEDIVYEDAPDFSENANESAQENSEKNAQQNQNIAEAHEALSEHDDPYAAARYIDSVVENPLYPHKIVIRDEDEVVEEKKTPATPTNVIENPKYPTKIQIHEEKAVFETKDAPDSDEDYIEDETLPFPDFDIEKPAINQKQEEKHSVESFFEDGYNEEISEKNLNDYFGSVEVEESDIEKNDEVYGESQNVLKMPAYDSDFENADLNESQIFNQIEQQEHANFSTAASDVFSDMEADIRKTMPAKKSAESAEHSAFSRKTEATNLTKDELSDFFNAQQEENTPKTKEIAANPPRTNRAAKKGPYVIPSDLLTAYKDDQYWIIDDATKQASLNLKQTLAEFNIEADIIGIKKGPVVTMFEILPAPGVKLSKIVALQDNIALSLAAQSVRIVAPIPGKQAVGIEVPNKHRSVVGFREIIEMDLPEWKKMSVPVVLGKDILGKAQLIDLVKTPHMLIAGATGSGKSVCVNSLILSILYKRSFEDVKMILVDPKVVELKLYNNIPHLLVPVITEPKKAIQALQWCLCEMERRYALLDSMGVRDISNYNAKIKEQKICTQKLPYIVVIIDEFADLMATSGKELETIVARLTAMSRAVGIHLVLATQRPSVNVITGLIKANIPTRIAFMVASRTDSNIIIDTVGAEKLLGRGDMLYASAVDPAPIRIQGTFVSDQEVENVVTAVKDYGEPDYIDEEIFVEDDDEETARDLFGEPMSDDDPLYDQALEIVVQSGKASASYIQRRLKIGYNRAARLVEEMEERGIVGPANGSKPRELIHIP